MSAEHIINVLKSSMAWLPRRGVGSFMTIEFGPPHLVVREAIPASSIPGLRRRRVFIEGKYRLWIQSDRWVLSTQEWSLSESETDFVDRKIDVLAGQALTRITIEPDGTRFAFEYGDELFAKADAIPDQTQWTFFEGDAGSLSLLNSGALERAGV